MTSVRKTRITRASLGPLASITRLDRSTCRLVVLNTSCKGTSAELRGDEELIIGADESWGLVLPDATVSGRHARVRRTEHGARIADLSSTNGTYYERSRIEEVVVPFGATVSFGRAQVKVLPAEEQVQANPSSAQQFGELMGADLRMREMFSLLADVAPTQSTVVLEGETGAGKELVAKALHSHSPRAKRPFVVFDCSSVPPTLLESTLFGHVRGAFTGATNTRDGAFRRAHGGTLFLDEIGELPPELQPRLLRCIESRTVQRVGSDDHEQLDVRVIAATNRNLRDQVKSGTFREDLYYRLAVVRVALPPLRERREDIPLLAQHFSRRARADVELDPVGLARLQQHPWPGNVRELRNVVERAMAMHRGPGALDLSAFVSLGGTEGDVPQAATASTREPSLDGAADGIALEVTRALDFDSGLSFRDAKAVVVEAFERRYLHEVYLRSAGNLTRAAQLVQMDRKHLRDLWRRYRISNASES
ncbi:MAG: sigma 54-interacting transcriptional regulator [Myxococcota bacterium]